MKKTLYFALLALTAAACSKEIAPAETEADEVCFCSAADGADSKTIHKDTPLKVELSWARGDRIGVWSTAEGAVLKSNSEYSASEESATTAFEVVSRGERIQWEKDIQSFYAYYPYSKEAGSDPEKVPFSIPQQQIRNEMDPIAGLGELDFLWAAAEDCTRGEDSEIALNFHHSLAFLDLELKTNQRAIIDEIVMECTSNPSAPLAFEGGCINLKTGEVTVGQAHSAIHLLCNKATELGRSTHFYIGFNPELGGETVEISAIIKGVKKPVTSRTIPEGKAGKMLNIKLDYEIPDDVAIAVKDLSELSAANCYIVSEADSYYKFRANVKGNGYVPAALTDVVGETSITPGSVLVFWYNCLQDDGNWEDECPVLINSLLYNDGYIYFDTPSRFVNGNVVIAAFSEEGLTYDNITADENYQINNATLLWSWNIWASEGYDPENSTLEANGVKIMDRNLGALISGTGSTGSFLPAYAVGNFYQWGRKDPIPPFADYAHFSPCDYGNKLYTTPTYTPIKALRLPAQGGGSNVMDQIFGYTNESGASVDTGKPLSLTLKTSFATAEDGPKVFTDYVTQNPHKFISGKYRELSSCNYGWISGKDGIWDNLWGNKNGERTKSVYDPCPAGWRVWDRTTAVSFFDSFVNEAVIDENLHGYNYKGSYFPLTAYRNHDHGKAEYVSATGYKTESHFWTSEAYDPHENSYIKDIRFLAPANYNAGSFTPEFVDSNRSYNADGMQLRCVKE